MQEQTQRRHRLVAAAVRLACDHDGVLSRAQLRDLGLTRFDVRREVRAGRWARHGADAIAVHTGPLDQRARWRVALIETSEHAALDGVSALQAEGLQNFDADAIHVSVPRGDPRRSVPRGCRARDEAAAGR